VALEVPLVYEHKTMPRKSNTSTTSAGDDGTAPRDGISVEDLSLPKTMVQRLAKGVLPANTQIQKDALLAISKSATVFVNYLSTHANDKATRMNKKTIHPKDVLEALQELEFDAFVPRCTAELEKYNAVQCDKRNTYRRKVREEAKAKAEADKANGVVESIPGPPIATIPTFSVRNRDLPPAAKKFRRENGDAAATPTNAQEREEEDEEGEDDDGEDDEMQDDPDQEEDVAEDDMIEEEDDEEEEHYEEEGENDSRQELVEDPLSERESGEEEEDSVLGDQSD
jgi:histone H3/H4